MQRDIPGMTKAVVLVVDDDDAARLFATNTLNEMGHRVVAAANGVEAIAAFEREHPDCVLLDIRMPGMDGFTVSERIRALPHGADVPVLVLTAMRDIETFDRALRAGADDFLMKPVAPTELVTHVQTALELRRTRKELREHYRLLKGQRDDLLRLQLQRERLMAFVVHDLRNPVNAIELHAQRLLRDCPLSEDARGTLAQIRMGTRHLHRMILDLLDLSQSEEGKLSPSLSRVELQPLVLEVVAEFEALAQPLAISFRSSAEPGAVRADPDLLRRMLTNLLENAMRHAPERSEVNVTVTVLSHDIELRVMDRGPGIPPDMRKRIFVPFVRLDAPNAQQSTGNGRGLGLAFCKAAAEAQNGDIWVEDASPGTVFCVRLPRA